ARPHRERHVIIPLSLSEAAVSFQVTVLKVLAGHPDGRLSVEDLKRAVAILICSGPEWTDRTRRLLARVPELDIFSQSLVIRDAQGWQITEAGRELLSAIEKSAGAPPAEDAPAAEEPMYSTSVPLPALTVGRRRGLRLSRNVVRPRRPAA
ncbi:MAG: hypothetical protein ACREDP_15180, partial [Bradyrhizobium sp.]